MNRSKKTVRASQSENDNMNNQIEWYDKNYSDEVSIPLKNTQYITFTFPSTFSFSPQLNAMLSRINNIYIEATKTKREMENIHIPRYLIIMFWLCVVLFISFLIVSTVMKTKMIKIYISFLLLGIITALLLVITIWNYNYKDPPLKMYDEIFCELVKKEIEKINEEFYNNELTKMKVHWLFDDKEFTIKVRSFAKAKRRGAKGSLSTFINKQDEAKMIEMSVIANSDDVSSIELKENDDGKKELIPKKEEKKKVKKKKNKDMKENEEENK